MIDNIGLLELILKSDNNMFNNMSLTDKSTLEMIVEKKLVTARGQEKVILNILYHEL